MRTTRTATKTPAKPARKASLPALTPANVRKLAWHVLARIWDATAPGSREHRMIDAECRRCGYTTGTRLRLAGSRRCGATW